MKMVDTLLAFIPFTVQHRLKKSAEDNDLKKYRELVEEALQAISDFRRTVDSAKHIHIAMKRRKVS